MTDPRLQALGTPTLPTHRDDQGRVLLSYSGLRFAHFCATYCVHTKGRWARKPVLLEPWQLVLFSEMLKTQSETWLAIEEEDLLDPWAMIEEAVTRPWFDVVPSRRVYTEAYLQMPEKTGKSTSLAALELYFLAFDGEDGAEVYAAATTVDQAGIVFGQARSMVERSPELSRLLTVYKAVIYHSETDSVFKAVSSEDAFNEGLNPHAVCVDELWAHRTRGIYDTLTSRLTSGTRLDPMAVVITNAGTDVDSICHEVYAQAKAVLEGAPGARDDLFGFVPEIPREHINDEGWWKSVNPQSWVEVEHLKRAQRKQPAFVFRRRRLNVWTAADESWLPPLAWGRCERAYLKLGRGEPWFPPDTPVWVGVDLGLKRDTAAVGVVAADTEREVLIARAHVWGVLQPGSAEAEAPACHELIWDERLDIKLIETWIAEKLAREWSLDVQEIVYDPYRFERSAQALSDLGFVVVEWPQTDQRMVPATEDMFEDITNERVEHDGDPVLWAHVDAGAAVETGRGIRLSKRLAKKPMDGLISVVMPAARARTALGLGTPSFELL